MNFLKEVPAGPAPGLPKEKAGYSFAVDLSVYAATSNFQCMVNQGYAAAFIRGKEVQY